MPEHNENMNERDRINTIAQRIRYLQDIITLETGRRNIGVTHSCYSDRLRGFQREVNLLQGQLLDHVKLMCDNHHACSKDNATEEILDEDFTDDDTIDLT